MKHQGISEKLRMNHLKLSKSSLLNFAFLQKRNQRSIVESSIVGSLRSFLPCFKIIIILIDGVYLKASTFSSSKENASSMNKHGRENKITTYFLKEITILEVLRKADAS